MFTRLTLCSPYDLSIGNFNYFPFWFRGQDVGHCLFLFTLDKNFYQKQNHSLYGEQEKKRHINRLMIYNVRKQENVHN